MAHVIELSSPPSSSESETPDIDIDELKDEISQCLSSVKGASTFALFETLSGSPNPGLYLKNGGVVGLPLSDRDAEAIIAASHEAPFGKGEQTVVDKSVRKTWELSPPDFELRNPAWGRFIESIVAKVSAGLGVDEADKEVSAQLYKMLLYDEGAMFKPHQDSEKAPGMFATLVITLPSNMKEVRSGSPMQEKQRSLRRPNIRIMNHHFWPDVTHEVKPVLSGHRLVLTYNLVHETLDPKELTASSARSVSTLKALLSQWNKKLGKTPEFDTAYAFLFEHQYTDASLRFNGLKGHDQGVASCIRRACDESGFYFYLAKLKRTVTGGCDGYYDDDSVSFHELTEEYEKSISLLRVIDSNGTEVAKNMTVDHDGFLHEEFFEDIDPDDEDYSGYTGNEGVSATHFYHRTIAILMPKTHRIDFFLNPSSPRTSRYKYIYDERLREYATRILQWFEQLTNHMSDNPRDMGVRQDLESVCRMVILESGKLRIEAVSNPTVAWGRKPNGFSDEVLACATNTSIALDNMSLFCETFRFWPQEPSSSMLRGVGKALVRYNLESLLPTISERLSAIGKLSNRMEMILALQTGYITEAELLSKPVTVAQDWAKSQMDTALNSAQISTAEDGAMLSNLCKTGSSEVIFNKILPAVKKNTCHNPMAMAFLAGVISAGLSGEIEARVSQTLFKNVVSDLASNFNLTPILHSQTNKMIKIYGFGARAPGSLAATDDGSEIVQSVVTLIWNCFALDCQWELGQILGKLVSASSNQPAENFDTIFIPLLQQLSRSLHDKNISVQGTSFKGFFQDLLRSYVVIHVGPEPKLAADWTRSRTSCPCHDCSELNIFLINPHQQVWRFPVAKMRRLHIHRILETMGGGFTHETERIGSPQTLVVTKTQASYLAARQAWPKRCSIAKGYLQSFNANILRELLGDLFDPIMSLSVSQLSQPPFQTTHISERLPFEFSHEPTDLESCPPTNFKAKGSYFY
ncbi:uncharacterized protein BP5553_09833 [Venustampulla echinocandica]|uniref:Prolyl 4-hydroxylase alpha subunit Fe(2+) 2OG dioxygenase domain-containing protein n=1 Tax=Venustampulla echinocandica TaxID=2656787 RepID=A0A370TAT0_9HELO|nr:uncharacterized protein BP5553_09833 [Venustampulla echinocandica]RDL31044.1 hypothetical protein BP5553_09833 [Venustampulla echinocandica]